VCTGVLPRGRGRGAWGQQTLAAQRGVLVVLGCALSCLHQFLLFNFGLPLCRLRPDTPRVACCSTLRSPSFVLHCELYKSAQKKANSMLPRVARSLVSQVGGGGAHLHVRARSVLRAPYPWGAAAQPHHQQHHHSTPVHAQQRQQGAGAGAGLLAAATTQRACHVGLPHTQACREAGSSLESLGSRAIRWEGSSSSQCQQAGAPRIASRSFASQHARAHATDHTTHACTPLLPTARRARCKTR